MISRHIISAASAVVLALAITSHAAATDPSVEQPNQAGLAIWLKGPFGTVLGGPLDKPARAAPDGRPLDTWTRGAALEVAAEIPFEDLDRIELSAQLLEGAGDEELLQRNGWWFSGPDRPGLQVVTARVGNDHGSGEASWLVHVPDREGGPETLFEMPVVETELRSAGGAVAGIRGHGCYVGMCQEVGLRPPPTTLEPLLSSIGETLELHLSDGSALVHWQGTLEPLPGTIAEDRRASATFDEEPRAAPALVGLEPTVAGEWLLEVRADYDRDRGWGWFLYRLIAQ